MSKKKESEKETKEEEKVANEKAEDNTDGEKDVESGDGESGEESDIEKKLKDTEDRLLRLTAEYSNFRKRSEKEKSESFAFATTNAVSQILPTLDNLERAIANEQEDYEGLKKGVQMTYDGLVAALEKMGVTPFGEAGEKFDPTLHNAVMHIEDESLESNVITDVFQKGYKLNDKIVRPAMVKTAN